MATELKFSTAYHSKIDGQTQVVNFNLTYLFQCLVGEFLTIRYCFTYGGVCI